ncbi:MAG TPA: tetratricopeptide repeat protein [Rhizomicrobium sp.]
MRLPRSLLLAALFFVTGSGQGAPQPINPNSYFLGASNHFDYWSRCSNRRIEPERRIQYCRSMIGRGHGDDADAWTQIGYAYMEQRKFDFAIDAFKSALGGYSGKAFGEAREGLDEVLALSGQYASAIDDLNDAIKITPEEPERYGKRCWVRAIAGKDLDLALADCNVALKNDPHNADVLDSRGLVEFELGKLNEAASDFQSALDREPHLESSLYMRGIIKLRNGDVVGERPTLPQQRTAIRRSPMSTPPTEFPHERQEGWSLVVMVRMSALGAGRLRCEHPDYLGR